MKTVAIGALFIGLSSNAAFTSNTSMEQRNDRMLLQQLEQSHDVTKLSSGAQKRIEDLQSMGDKLNSIQKDILKIVNSNYIGSEAKDLDLLAQLKREKDNIKLSPKEEAYLKHLDKKPNGSLTPTQDKIVNYIPLRLLSNKEGLGW